MNAAIIRRRQLMNMVKIEEAEGSPIVFSTNTQRGLAGLQLYGASIQDGAPSVNNPVDWTNKGSNGQININLMGGNLYIGKDVVASSIKSVTGYFDASKYIKNIFSELKDGEYTISYDVEGGEKPGSNIGKLGFQDFNFSDTYKQPQTLIVPTPNGLPGIPVDSGGNYTDRNGQHWVADYVDYEIKEYVQCTDYNEILIPDSASIKKTSDFRYIITFNENITKSDNFKNNSGSLFNMFKYKAFGNKEPNYSTASIRSANSLYLSYIENIDEETLKQKVVGKTLKMLYLLKTPIHTPLSPEEIQAFKELYAYSPTTTISNDTDVWMKVKYKVRR